MRKLSADVVNRYPVVAVFFAEDNGRFKSGVHSTHLIRSNGVAMLCCDDDGDVHIIPLSLAAKVSPRNNDFLLCRFDAMTGHIVYRKPNGPEVFSTGPIKGKEDRTIDLRVVAESLGLDYQEILDDNEPVEANIPTIRGLTTQEVQAGPSERTVDELLRLDDDEDGAMLSDEELQVPDLDSMLLDDDLGMHEDFGLDREHKGRVSGD